MSTLSHRSGGLVISGGSLVLNCGCCDGNPCTICGGCDLTTTIVLDERTNEQGYYRYSRVEIARQPPDGPNQGPWYITWKTGYPAALDCYFWWYSYVYCNATTGSLRYSVYMEYYRLYQCENGVAVNRTNDAITSASFEYDFPVQVNVENTAYGYVIKRRRITGYPEDAFDDLNGACDVEVADVEPLDPEFVC